MCFLANEVDGTTEFINGSSLDIMLDNDIHGFIITFIAMCTCSQTKLSIKLQTDNHRIYSYCYSIKIAAL